MSVSLSTSMPMTMKKNLILAVWILPKHVQIELYNPVHRMDQRLTTIYNSRSLSLQLRRLRHVGKKSHLKICHATSQKHGIKSETLCLSRLQDLKNQALHSFTIESKMLQEPLHLKEKTLKRTVACQLLSINTAYNSFSQLIEIRNNMVLGSCEINYNGHLPFKTSLNLYLPFEPFCPYKQ